MRAVRHGRARGGVLRAFLRCDRGSALVEAAIVTPVIVMLIAGMFELTRAIARYHMVDKGLRAGVRYLARVPSATAVETWGLAHARCLATRGVVADAVSCDTVGSCIVAGWCDSAARSGITANTSLLSAAPRRLRVAADVTFGSPLFALFGNSGSIRVRVEHEEPFIGE